MLRQALKAAFQMGFGPCIEHEILTQPYVVDLLVTLCYSSVLGSPSSNRAHYPIRNFPIGLRLKVPSVLVDIKPTGPAINCKVDLKLQSVILEEPRDVKRISEDTWVVFRPKAEGPAGLVTVYHAYIKHINRQSSSLDVEVKDRDLSTTPAPVKVEMEMFLFDTEFDDLDSNQKAKAIMAILQSVPPIAHIREYLIKAPYSTLRSYTGLSSAAKTLLEWIVASNRSCILQVSPVLDQHAQDKHLLETIKIREQETIPSMGDCVQFRFAQGAPDKELRFHRALKDVKVQKKTDFPTLFAWHGSALGNWHSILRHGLDFKETHNGRAFGHGVYFSQDYTVSQGYTSIGGYHSYAGSWPNSALNATGVISLCEIINAPESFVSNNPYLVVAQTDWIQCRYLFVQKFDPSRPDVAFPGDSASTINEQSVDASREAIQEIPQDPQRQCRAPTRKTLRIPVKAIPSGRLPQTVKRQPSTSSIKRSFEMVQSLAGTDEEHVSDLECLFSDTESVDPPPKRTDPRSSGDDSVSGIAAQEVTVKRPPTPPVTDFRPGTLDLTSLPRLPMPAWANAKSTKRLTEDIKQLQKVQATTPLSELGWSIDFDRIDNMFQWIVEIHSFDPELPLAKDMKKAGITSIVLEVRFGSEYPFSPPFIRVIRPRFLPFMNGGGGHVTMGGALCMELLTSTGWTPAMSMEAVFVSIKMAMSSTDPQPARLESTKSSSRSFDYGAHEALAAFIRAANQHGWTVPNDFRATAGQTAT